MKYDLRDRTLYFCVDVVGETILPTWALATYNPARESSTDWVQINELNNIDFVGLMNISFFTTKSTNLYENKFIASGGIRLFEFAFEESNISDSGSEISTESDEDDMDLT
ncbi:hypothetical protein OUZ56_016587 [Daphnia magna]|uniref:Uncharacterized protein n=1 Tax=Daphnia magna TaxID=35525 RepID=A0ABR0AR38_9CRUS|nr:hypothetical protein OUZ56_016587 [Daphnia magna]